jgi:hypothetical protein
MGIRGTFAWSACVRRGEYPVALYMWVSVGDPGRLPERVRAESRVTCSAVVIVDRFDAHGLCHHEIERHAGMVER